MKKFNKFIERVNCEWGGFNQGLDEKIEAYQKISKTSFELGKEYENIYTDIVTDGISSWFIFSKEPFHYTEAQEWFEELEKDFEKDFD